MNELQIFKNEEFEVKAIEVDGKPYFLASSVAHALGYSNPNDAIRRHCKGCVKHDTLTKGGKQALSYITEGDVYRLVMRSKLPSAERFETWVCDEILPSIRKNGGYIANQENLTPEQIVANALVVANKIIEEREKQIVELNNVVLELKPKADYTDVILSCKDSILVTQIANDYGMSAIGFNKLLHDLGVQYKVGGQWILYSQYQGNGYTVSKTHTYQTSTDVKAKLNTEWTQKGRMFLYHFLKSRGYLPMVEQ